MTRKYELRKRAEGMADTRRRITDATIELHGSVGPARTTIAGIAERAGVQRHTVYRHFPTDDELFTACSSQFWADHPWPDVAQWRVVQPAGERLTTALHELYAFYADVEPMMVNVLRDSDVLAVVARAVAPFQQYLDDVVAVLLSGFRVRGKRRERTAVALRHAAAFCTWQSLAGDGGLSRADAVLLAAAMVQAAAVS